MEEDVEGGEMSVVVMDGGNIASGWRRYRLWMAVGNDNTAARVDLELPPFFI